jgi:crotonobetainyl-CoA:carnitine CoA-transferase CaiB-like acyl-CoA transferase
MGGYDFLQGLLVIEVAKLGPGALGGYLADMGATVIKVEEPGDGDYVRYTGAYAAGDENGMGFMFLRWNRGKKSIALNLRMPDGMALFKKFAAKADVVIEGMRAGVLDRLGIGHEALRQINPKLVYCSLSGLGLSGPYAARGSHGPSFDAFGGLAQAPDTGSVSRYQEIMPPPVGMYAMGLHAALGVLSAVIRAQRTGQGALIEVAAAESAAHWLTDALEPVLNEGTAFVRPGFNNSDGRMARWPLMDNYRTKDGQVLLLQVLMPKFWDKFWRLLDRPDLEQIYANAASPEAADAEIARQLTTLMASRDFAEWDALFSANDIPFIKVNSYRDLVQDPHFLARNNVYDVKMPNGQNLRLTSTPVKVHGQDFAPPFAPATGEHSDAILHEILHLTPAQIMALRERGTVA